MSVARMNDAYVLAEMNEIRDGFEGCCILSKEDVSDTIKPVKCHYDVLNFNFIIYLPFVCLKKHHCMLL